MHKLKTEMVIENDILMVINHYTKDGTNICATVKTPVSDENALNVMPEPEATQLDRIEAQTAYIAMMMDGGDI